MAVYQTSGIYLMLNEGSPGYIPADTTNNITGNQGTKYIRILNSSTTYVAAVNWILNTQTYTYTNVSAGVVVGTGSLATFNVVISALIDGTIIYTVTVNSGGNSYGVDTELKIPGTSVGGFEPDNDITFTVTSIGEDGIITGISSATGTPNWPPTDQSPTGSTSLLPGTETVVQTQPNDNTPTGITLTTLGAGSDPIYVEVVNVIG